MSKINLFDLDEQGLHDFFIAAGEKAFRARQCMQWLHQERVLDFQLMTNFSKPLRNYLATHASLELPSIKTTQASADGTRKWLISLSCGNSVETVFIPEGERGTLCVSSQIGCGLTCSFCSTAKQGFNRNLSTSEIIGQVWLAVDALTREGHARSVTNVVMMGMGEPLLNFDNVLRAMNLMLSDFAYGLSKRRVTLSTSGLVPQMEQLKKLSDVSLAVSLHAPTNELRNELVPINKKYPLEQLIPVCQQYFGKSRRKVTFEYVMLDGVNDTFAHAKALAKLIADVPCKINLIPFNPFPGTHYRRSSDQAIDKFRSYLMSKGFNTTVRKTRGDDIDAACGQLAGKVNDRTSRSKRWQEVTFHKNMATMQ